MARPAKSLLKDSHPQLADQVVDKTLLERLSTGSSMRVEWECELGHRWHASVYNRTNAKASTGCPVCKGKVILPGFNDLATVCPDVAALLVDQSLATKLCRTSGKKVMWRCAKGHEWQAPVSRLTYQGSRCPYCSGRLAIKGETDLKTRYPEIAAELVEGPDPSELTVSSNKRCTWECSTCGYLWVASVYHRTRGNGCPRCSGRVIVEGDNDFATAYPQYVTTLVHPEMATKVGKASEVKLEWRCANKASHTWLATPSNRVKSVVDRGCPICDNKFVMAGENDLATTHPELAAELVEADVATQVSAGSGRKVAWKCSKGHVWEIAPYHRTGKNPTGCPVCNPTGTSNMEKDLAGCVKALMGDEEVQTNVTGMLDGRMELDIVVPSAHVAIEFNGVRWHSEEMGKDRSYHKDKMRKCSELGYKLVQVWEDDWTNRKAIVIRMLAAKLGVSDRLVEVFSEIDPLCSDRVYARKLACTSVRGSDAMRFLDENHVQGRVTATEHFGLVDDAGRLRAVLSVRSPRNSARMKRQEGEWEIQRYATCGTVVGGFTKLMKYAENALASRGVVLRRWVSFSSNDVSDGSMYDRCGFFFDKELPPDYRYVGDKIGWWRHPKEKFQKKRFMSDPNFVWEDGWTERQAASANGLFRVWDAGKIRWVKDVMGVTSGFVENETADVMVVPCLVGGEIESKAVQEASASSAASASTEIPAKPKLKRGGPLIDLAGKTLGDWKVIERVEDRVDARGKRWPTWSCECIHCGKKAVAGGDRLRSGTIKLCECRKAARKANKEMFPRKRRSDARNMSSELVAQLVDASNASLPASSHEKVEWRCDKGHVWAAEVASRTAGSGCPYCSGRRPVPGENDLATLRPDLAEQLVHPEEAETVGVGSGKKLEWRCTVDSSHTWLAPVRNRANKGTGCPHCRKRGAAYSGIGDSDDA